MNTILITGAGTGLGKELALAYADRGDRIILVGRTAGTLNEVKKLIENTKGSSTVAPCDINNGHSVTELVERLKRTEKIDKLINNAGIGYFGSLQDMSMEEINHMIDTNVKGTIFMTKEVLPLFFDQQSGSIMNIISTAGLRGKVKESAYVASKFAIRGFTESLIKELKPTSIKVSAVYMGGMNTPFWNGTDFIKDISKLKSAKLVAKEIIEREEEEEIIIN